MSKPLTLYGHFRNKAGTDFWGKYSASLNADVAYNRDGMIVVHTVSGKVFVADPKEKQHDRWGDTNEQVFNLWRSGK